MGLAPGNFCWPFDTYYSSSWSIRSADFGIHRISLMLFFWRRDSWSSRSKVSLPLPNHIFASIYHHKLVPPDPLHLRSLQSCRPYNDGTTLLLDQIAILDDIQMRACANDWAMLVTLFVFHSSAGYHLVSQLFAQPQSLVITIQRLYICSSYNPTFHMPHADYAQPRSFLQHFYNSPPKIERIQPPPLSVRGRTNQ